MMKFIQLFIFISSASAAILPMLTRPLAVGLNRKMKQPLNLPEDQLSLSLTVPKLPDLSPLGRALPVSYCEESEASKYAAKKAAAVAILKQRLEAEYALFSSSFALSKQQLSVESAPNSKRYEKALIEEDYEAISEAYKNGEINFHQIPKECAFYHTLLLMDTPESTEIIKKYFEAGIFDKKPSRHLRLLSQALAQSNFVIANLILDHMIVTMLKDIESGNYCQFLWKFNPRFSQPAINFHMSQISDSKFFSFGAIPFTDNEKEALRFYTRYNRIWADDPLVHWKIGNTYSPVAHIIAALKYFE